MTDLLQNTDEELHRGTVIRALKEIQSLRAELERRPPAPGEIVIASAACRLPQADSPEALWDQLRAGAPTAGPVPAGRWDNDQVFAPYPGRAGSSYVDRASFVEGAFSFDPEPFGMSPREAQATDPHHRLVLQCAWEALERAGISPTSLRGSRTGVFVGMSGNDFERLRVSRGRIDEVDGLSSMGSSVNFAANRLSYVLGLQGPSLVVDTACSSSLVALHQARRALDAGDCDLAVVAGVNLMLSAEAMIALSQGRLLSPTGRCHTFSEQADGYARGEGCVVVVLERSADRAARWVRPLGTLLSTAVNQDGPSSGITVPNGLAQADLVRQAIKGAGLVPDDVDYAEAHGTGTPLGDPIELRSLASVHGNRRGGPLLVGATKPVTGHLEGAAGLVGLLKCLMVVEHGRVPAQPVDGTLTGGFDWDASNLTVPTTDTVIEASRPVAGVSSFGFGGTNAHAIVRRWAPDATVGSTDVVGTDVGDGEDSSVPLSIRLSGASPAAVEELARRYVAILGDHGPFSAATVCRTALIAQGDLGHRVSVVAEGLSELLAGLAAAAAGESHRTHVPPAAETARHLVDVESLGAARPGDLGWIERLVPGVRGDAERLLVAPPGSAWVADAPGDAADRTTTAYFWAVCGLAVRRLGLTPRISGNVPDTHDPSTWPTDAAPVAAQSTLRGPDAAGGHAGVRLLRAVHAAWRAGAAVRWGALGRPAAHGEPGPTYPWQTVETLPLVSQTEPGSTRGPGLALRVLRTGDRVVQGRAEICAQTVPLLSEHVVHGQMVVPGVVLMELVLRLAEAVVGVEARVQTLEIVRPCIVAPGLSQQLVLVWDGSGPRPTVTVTSESGSSGGRHHATATLELGAAPAVADARFSAPSDRVVQELTGDEFYRTMWPEDFHIGPSLRLVDRLWRHDDGRLRSDLSPAPERCAAVLSGVRPDLLVLDAAIQIAGALREDRADGVVTLGTGFSALEVAEDADLRGGALVTTVATGDGRADVHVGDRDGKTLAVLTGVTNLPVTVEQLTRVTSRPAGGAEVDGGESPEQRVRAAVASILRVDPAAIEPDARLEDLMDSILLVELAEALSPYAPSPLAVPDLLEARTVDGAVKLLGPDQEATVAVIDGTGPELVPPLRKRELTVEALSALAAATSVPAIDSVPREDLPPGILLTGATGFVGTHLLRELLDATDRHVYCLVRADDTKEAEGRLVAAAASQGLSTDDFDARVTAVVGDLAQERFGMTDEAYAHLLGEVGEIFHNAGAVKWTASYEQLAPHNVQGTAEVLRFATDGTARTVHFTSTVGVFSSDRVDLGVVDESVDLTDSGALVVGYAQTKWVSEMMIRRAGEQGLRFTVHRINSGPALSTGGYNRLDHLSLIIKGCVESGLAPSDGPFPVQAAPIDHVARAYVRLALDPAFEGRTSHLVNEPVVPWSEFFEHLEDYGYELERLPFEEWRTAVTGRRSGTLALLGLAPFLTRTIDDVHLADFGAPATRAALGAESTWCPVIDRAVAHRFLDGFVAGRFIEAPTS